MKRTIRRENLGILLLPGLLLLALGAGARSASCQTRPAEESGLVSPGDHPDQTQPEVEAVQGSLESRGLSLGLALWRVSQADELVSPLRYSGLSWGVSLGMDLSGPKAARRLSLAYSGPTLTSSATRDGIHQEESHRVSVGITYLHRVGALESPRLTLLLGGAMTADGALYRHRYREEKAEDWGQVFLLVEPGVGWRLQLSDGAFVGQEITVPLAGFVVRPPYQGLTEVPAPAFEGPGRVKGIRQSIHYWREMWDGWRGGVSYTFQGFRYPDPRPVAWTRHTLTFHLVLWGGSPR